MNDAGSRTGPAAPAPDADDAGAQAPGAFRRTLTRVLTMQLVTLALLWILQSWFSR